MKLMPSTPVLTPRELDVLARVAEGKTNREVALVLGIAPATVRKHLENAFRKLGVRTRTAAVAQTFRVLPGEPNQGGVDR